LLNALAEEVGPERASQVSFTGYEVDQEAAALAARSLSDLNLHSVEIVTGDYLSQFMESQLARPSAAIQKSLFDTDDLTATGGLGIYDIVISNPPYVRTQVMGARKSRELAHAFGLTGRVDLAHAFIIAMSSTVADDGVLALLTSNRFMTTLSGAQVRAFLRSHFQIDDVFDLGDTKLFAAAVLPAVVIAVKQPDGGEQSSNFVRVYQTDSMSRNLVGGDAILSALMDPSFQGEVVTDSGAFAVERGQLAQTRKPTDPWRLATPHTQRWLQALEQTTYCRFRDVVSIKVGVKTTADSVFIRTEWESLPAETRPEAELLHPLLTHYEAGQVLAESGPARRILYPYDMNAGCRQPLDLSRYPGARAYLESHRGQLEARHYLIAAGRSWYEIWVPQKPAEWQSPKIVFPDISCEPRFFLDMSGAVVQGDCYWLSLKPGLDGNWLYVILGVANSTVATAYYDALFHNKLYAGRRRFMTQYVADFPLPRLESTATTDLVDAVKEIVERGDVRAEDLAIVNQLTWASLGLGEEEVLRKRQLELGVPT
jgi:hypothetical protein